MDIPTEDISRYCRYRIFIFLKIKISEIEKAPTLITVKELIYILFQNLSLRLVRWSLSAMRLPENFGCKLNQRGVMEPFFK